MAITQKITTNLWFNNEAAEAAEFYTGIFKNSAITRTTRYSDEGFEIHKRPAGSVMTVEYELEGRKFVNLNGGPWFPFNEAISFIIGCSNQEEVDYYWARLSEGGDPKAQQCGWLKDKYGVSWQVVPTEMDEMFDDENSDAAKRATRAMLAMEKLDIAALRAAYKG